MSDPSQIVLLPPKFENVDMIHLVNLIDMLQRLIAHNDRIPLSPESLTRFHSRSPPAISVLEYLQRIVKYTNVEKTCLLITLHYIDQMCGRVARFTISSLTVHRFLISSITVSSKALCDVFCTNSHYAKVGGLRVVELNILEKELLAALDWRLTCTKELLQEYYINLARTYSTPGQYRFSEEPSALPFSTSPDSFKELAQSPTLTPVQQGTDFDEPDTGKPTTSEPETTLMTIAEPSTVLMGKAPGFAGSPHVQPGVTTLEQNMAFASLHSPEGLSPESHPRPGKRSNTHLTEPPAINDVRPSKRKTEDFEC